MARRKALSDGDRSQRSGPGCLILFGLVFGGFGSLFFVIFFLLPLWRALDALATHMLVTSYSAAPATPGVWPRWWRRFLNMAAPSTNTWAMD